MRREVSGRIGPAAACSHVGLAAALALAGLLLAPMPPAGAVPLGPNGKVAFFSDRDANDLYETVPGGGFTFPVVGSANRLTTIGYYNAPAGASDPSWSPDGTKVAFVTNLTGNYEIFTQSQENNFNLNQVTNNPSFDADPAWSPDGTKIAFASDRDGNFNIYKTNADGSGTATPLTTDPARDGFPAWSPDGTKIAFESERDGNLNVYVMNADGSGQTPLTTDPASDGSPSWSPDGSRIAFRTNRLGDYDIATMNANGSGVLTIQVPGSFEQWPAWSPDGTKIAFQTNRDGNYEIYAMKPDGSGVERLTDDPGVDAEPDWQRSYDSPGKARQLAFSLVPNFRQTISASQCSARGGVNSTHGPPDIPGGSNPDASCNPPAFAPGTVAHLGNHAAGSVVVTRMRDDVLVEPTLTDVRSGSATGADYNVSATQDINVVAKLRITDQRNCRPAPCSAGVDAARDTFATVTDSDISLPVNCTPTADTTVGSSCTAVTSFNSVLPGLVVPNDQTIIQLFRLRVNDAGVDGTLGNADDRAFAQQGIYVR
jgi:hypothetical protein